MGLASLLENYLFLGAKNPLIFVLKSKINTDYCGIFLVVNSIWILCSRSSLCFFQKPVPVIMKVKKLADSPDSKPAAAEKAPGASEFTPDKQEVGNNKDSEEEKQEAELEIDADAKSKRSASITRNDPAAQSLLAM